MPVQIPLECLVFKNNVDDLNAQLDFLQEELGTASPVDKPRIIKQIVAKQNAIERAEEELSTCIADHPPTVPPPPATTPVISSDTTLKTVQKVISWSLLQKKMDEFFNQRTDPPIFRIRLHHHDYIPPGSNTIDNDPPASDVTISMLEATVVNGQVTTEYATISSIDLGQLDNEYYFDDVNSNAITVSLDPSQPEPITVKINFECDGPTEAPSTGHLYPDLDMLEFYITLKLSFDVVRVPAPPPSQCLGLKNELDNLNAQLEELQDELGNAAPVDKPRIIKEIGAKQTAIGKAEDELRTCMTTYGGPDAFGFGRLEFLSWVEKISNLRDDDFDEALKKYVVAHIVSPNKTDFGGTFQGRIRSKIYNKLKDPATRLTLNSTISKWILGGTGSYDVITCVNDGQNLTINYMVPANKLDPFPDSMFRPVGWPYLHNPNPDPSIDFSIPHNLGNITHIVVLTMENRSFDQMLGYLSLPVNAGGMGRKDVDGLQGGESNFFNGTRYPSFPFAPGDTAFAPDPPHSYEPVFTQINADVQKPGSGKMDGFVNAFSHVAGLGAGPRIMGYHTAVNLPVYDALARDFSISHRWFASHPGPTFTNRFYELTGRLNLASGLNSQIPENTWEFSNSSPLTPVFNKTIFDYISDYQRRISRTLKWKYYENGYCFLRFFSKYTFDNTHVFSIDDPVNGFFADAKNGKLPSVSFIDPHFIELPPKANADGPVADIKDGQAFVQKVVEAVVTSPQFANTLLIITYDEHGGFFDHKAPPPAVPFSDESPIKTYGIRVPAFFISPWVKAGGVFGHDGDSPDNTLHFDHTSILKTIARRFLAKDPPYMGRRYAAAKDLSPVLESTHRKFKFLPFIRYNLMYNASQKMLDVQLANPAPGTVLWQWLKNGSVAQDFSIEEKHDFVYIRTHTGNLYLTADVPDNMTAPPQGFGIKQDVKYEGGNELIDPKKFNSKYQLWKITPTGTAATDKNMFIISNAAFPDRVLQPASIADAGALIVLDGAAATGGLTNAWNITSPVIEE